MVNRPSNFLESIPSRAGGNLAVILAVMGGVGLAAKDVTTAKEQTGHHLTAIPVREQYPPELGLRKVLGLIQDFGLKDPKKCDDAVQLLEKRMDFETYLLLARAAVADKNPDVREKAAELERKYCKQFYNTHGIRYDTQAPTNYDGWPWIYFPPQFSLPPEFKRFEGQEYSHPSKYIKRAQAAPWNKPFRDYADHERAGELFFADWSRLDYRAGLGKENPHEYWQKAREKRERLLQWQIFREEDYRWLNNMPSRLKGRKQAPDLKIDAPPPRVPAAGGSQSRLREKEGVEQKQHAAAAQYHNVMHGNGMPM